MRNGLLGLASVTALAWIMAASGCTDTSSNPGSGGTTGSGGKTGGTSGSGGSSGGTSGSGGSSGGTTGSGGRSGSGGSPASGGSGGTTSAPNCPNGSSCGGSLVGTWNVTSSCLALSGDMDGYLLYLGCAKVPVTGSLSVTGTWTANSDGSYTDNTTTTGSMTFPLSSSCLTVSSAPVECTKMAGAFTAAGWASATCTTDAGDQCNCSATANQKGGIGVIYANASDKGTYQTSGGSLTVDEEAQYSYCVSSTTLTLTPKSAVLPLAGTVVLQKSGPPGTGGASGGASGSGGKAGAGGTTTGSGGATTGSGGATTGAGGKTTGTGGAAGSGGKGGTGGATIGTGGTAGAGGTTATGGATGKGPCDIYAEANSNCVAAHSTVRALFAGYAGKLYQVKRASDSKTQDIGVTADGFADSAAQETFCTGTTCVITFVYDQSGNGNDVEAETADSKVGGNKGQTAANAAQEPFTVGGHKVYSLYLKQSQAYWKDGSKSKVPLGKSPQAVYMVTSGKHQGSGCCFDYGNGPLSRSVSGCGTMDAVNFSSNTMWEKGAGSGPWVMADFECGLKAGGNPNANVPSMAMSYVTAIEKNNGTSEYALKGADATTGKLTSYYKGKLPFTQAKEGAIILGSGGDCCYSNTTLSQGTFYEGAIVAGYPTDETEDAVQANIVAAQYGK
jgi:non-reducing end alpha-L-arabinofuranosidase